VQNFNLVRAHKPNFYLFIYLFAIALFEFFSCPFPFLFLSRRSGCRKKVGVNYGQSLEMGP